MRIRMNMNSTSSRTHHQILAGATVINKRDILLTTMTPDPYVISISESQQRMLNTMTKLQKTSLGVLSRSDHFLLNRISYCLFCLKSRFDIKSVANPVSRFFNVRHCNGSSIKVHFHAHSRVPNPHRDPDGQSYSVPLNHVNRKFILYVSMTIVDAST